LKKLLGLIISAALLLTACGNKTTPTAPAPTSATTQTDPARQATLTEIVNDVARRAAESEAFAPAATGSVITAGGQIKTGAASKVRLDFDDGSIIRLADNSLFTLQDLKPAAGGLLTTVKLEAGKIWVSLTGGTTEIESPVGVASVRGSFAVFEYQPGDPNNPADDVLIVECLEGTCRAQNDSGAQDLGNFEQLTLGKTGEGTRTTLTGEAVQDFLQNNPEGQRIAATLTAAAPTSTLIPTETDTPTATNTSVPTDTRTPIPTATHTRSPRPTSTSTPSPTSTMAVTPTATCEPGSFYDPFQQRCRPPDTPVTPSATFSPAPTLSGISPASAPVGSPGFTLTVNGANFVPGSVVQWNGAPLATTFVSNAQLTAAVPASNLTAVASIAITVVNPDGNTTAAATFTTVGQTANLGLTPSSITTVYGQTLDLVATVSSGAGTPTGSVTLTLNGVAQATAPLVGGQATWSVSTLGVGLHTLQIVYSGDGVFAPGASTPLSQTVNKANTLTTVTASGPSVTITVSVIAPGSGAPTGLVSYSVTGAATGSPASPVPSGTVVTLTGSPGPYAVNATYPGDSNFNGSSGSGSSTLP